MLAYSITMRYTEYVTLSGKERRNGTIHKKQTKQGLSWLNTGGNQVMTIAVDYQPTLYIFDGDWFCQHVGDIETKSTTVDTLNSEGEHETYEQYYDACAECGEEL